MQNIPVRSERAGEIRQPSYRNKDGDLLTADYSQIELRLLGHFTDDEALQRAFAEDRDVHSTVAAQIFGVEGGIDFGNASYGQDGQFRRHLWHERPKVWRSAWALGAKRRTFIEAYFARYPKVLEYQAKLLQECLRTGYVSTILGRRRTITGSAVELDVPAAQPAGA